MQFTNTVLGLAAVAVTSAAAPAPVTATSSPFQVKVGADGLTYTPSNIIAEVGTQIEFNFFPKNHTVTQSNFKDPCQPLSSGGFFSGFVPTQPGNTGNTFTITVTDKKPIWFYCSQTTGTHCQAGMVGSINAAQTGNATLDAFILLAKNAPPSTFPQGGPKGGVLKIASGNGNLSTTTAGPPPASITTSAILSTYTSDGKPYTTTVGSSTVPVGTGGNPSPTGSTPITPNAASGTTANMALVGAVLFGAMAFM